MLVYLGFCYTFRILVTCECLLTWFIKLSFIASTLLVFCEDKSMGMTLRRSYLPKQVNIHNLHLRDNCPVGYNKTHVFSLLRLPTAACGTICQKTDQIKSYTNSLSEEQRSSSGGKKRYLFFANFTCSYNRKNIAGSLSFLPARRSLLVTRSKYMEGGEICEIIY